VNFESDLAYRLRRIPDFPNSDGAGGRLFGKTRASNLRNPFRKGCQMSPFATQIGACLVLREHLGAASRKFDHIITHPITRQELVG